MLNRATIYKRWLELEDDKGLSNADKIAMAMIEKAMSGDVQAAKEAMDSGMGKVKDVQEITGAEGQPISLDVTRKILGHLTTEQLREIVKDGESDV